MDDELRLTLHDSIGYSRVRDIDVITIEPVDGMLDLQLFDER